MLDVKTLNVQALEGLSPSAVTELAASLIAQLAATQAALQAKDAQIEAKDEEIARRDHEIKFKDARLERLTFQLAQFKAWKFGARTEAMNAEQRHLFEEAAAEDEADLEAQIAALKAEAAQDAKPADDKRRPRRAKLPEHLRRVDHHHEPETTTCDCGEPMRRVGEDVSERLDVVPAEFFVHRHIYGKWACKCCSARGEGRLTQEPAEPQIIDKGMPAEGLLAHTLVARYVDHLPYYRQETINARSGVHTPRSTLAAWSGAAAGALQPLYEAHRAFVLSARVLHADETPVKMLDPGAGKTTRAYVWAYARGEHDDAAGVIYEFCRGRGSKYPADFLAEWRGTLTCDDYGGYNVVIEREGCVEAGCLAHARRKFDELAKAKASAVAELAIQRIAKLYRIEAEVRTMDVMQRLTHRQQYAAPLWEELHAWMQAERGRVPDGGATAAALDYSLRRWKALGRFLHDGAVSIDNNHLENLMRPWAMGRKAWLFAGSELAGQRAAMVMSLVQSAKMHGHDPWAYLRDVLERLLAHPNHRLDELLPHRWRPCDAAPKVAA
ncbi:IS66 family transposase [Ideonella sp. B508-1]|uniref:IS66 family transposase n=1 Tax=Ideonella sp. B508-1 TaxID=137716 RepID=UPI00047820E4|nr:IS66 family transposase [Ideonella sp. B508-1]